MKLKMKKNIKSFKNTKDVNKTCINEALKISLDRDHKYWEPHCRDRLCLNTKKNIRFFIIIKNRYKDGEKR